MLVTGILRVSVMGCTNNYRLGRTSEPISSADGGNSRLVEVARLLAKMTVGTDMWGISQRATLLSGRNECPCCSRASRMMRPVAEAGQPR